MSDDGRVDLADFLLARIADKVDTWQLLLEDDPQDRMAEWMLADLAAKQVIVKEHAPDTVRTGWDTDETYCSTCYYDDGMDRDVYPCRTIRAVAAPWFSHPDFNPEWSL